MTVKFNDLFKPADAFMFLKRDKAQQKRGAPKSDKGGRDDANPQTEGRNEEGAGRYLRTDEDSEADAAGQQRNRGRTGEATQVVDVRIGQLCGRWDDSSAECPFLYLAGHLLAFGMLAETAGRLGPKLKKVKNFATDALQYADKHAYYSALNRERDKVGDPKGEQPTTLEERVLCGIGDLQRFRRRIVREVKLADPSRSFPRNLQLSESTVQELLAALAHAATIARESDLSGLHDATQKKRGPMISTLETLRDKADELLRAMDGLEAGADEAQFTRWRMESLGGDAWPEGAPPDERLRSSLPLAVRKIVEDSEIWDEWPELMDKSAGAENREAGEQ